MISFRVSLTLASYPDHVGGGKSGLVSTVCACAIDYGCRELEKHFGTKYTDAILEGGDEVSMHEVKKVVNQAYRVSKLE